MKARASIFQKMSVNKTHRFGLAECAQRFNSCPSLKRARQTRQAVGIGNIPPRMPGRLCRASGGSTSAPEGATTRRLHIRRLLCSSGKGDVHRLGRTIPTISTRSPVFLKEVRPGTTVGLQPSPGAKTRKTTTLVRVQNLRGFKRPTKYPRYRLAVYYLGTSYR